MDMEEIRYLLGGTIFARAKAYTDRIQDLNCEVAGNGVRHLSADVRGGGRSLYQTQVWLRENGSFVSASCSCPYNENGEGPCCKHIGALLMRDSESQGLSGRAPQRPSESPESIPGVVRGTASLQTPQPEEPPRRDSYASSLEMLFGKKWRGEEPESDYEPFGHDYSDDISVNDAAEEVRALRAKGIHVSAVFMGNDAAANSAEKIYGKEFTRIRRIDELAKAAGRLIQKEIQSLTR